MKEGGCYKCGFPEAKHTLFGTELCSFCYNFAPENNAKFNIYKEEKVDCSIIETYRKNFSPKGERQKKGMFEKASSGKVVSRAPFGYTISEGKLIPDREKSLEVKEIFEEFLSEDKPRLKHLAEKHGLSINGLKKILKNFSYLGKVKFNHQIHQGEHPAIISSTDFNHVQDKLKKLGVK